MTFLTTAQKMQVIEEWENHDDAITCYLHSLGKVPHCWHQSPNWKDNEPFCCICLGPRYVCEHVNRKVPCTCPSAMQNVEETEPSPEAPTGDDDPERPF